MLPSGETDMCALFHKWNLRVSGTCHWHESAPSEHVILNGCEESDRKHKSDRSPCGQMLCLGSAWQINSVQRCEIISDVDRDIAQRLLKPLLVDLRERRVFQRSDVPLKVMDGRSAGQDR